VRPAEFHKGDAGHLLVIGGSRGKSGAAALAAQAALRAGAGLVTVATRPDALDAVMAHVVEAMGVALPEGGPLALQDLNALLEAAEDKDAVVIGPGLPRGEETVKLLGDLLEELACPVLLDADALNALASAPELLARARGPLTRRTNSTPPRCHRRRRRLSYRTGRWARPTTLFGAMSAPCPTLQPARPGPMPTCWCGCRGQRRIFCG
jgi:NAD(P)H-hydrate repair Nnr-like enzyme with NAD(P)H-hydrate dehydratase domain